MSCLPPAEEDEPLDRKLNTAKINSWRADGVATTTTNLDRFISIRL